MTSRLMNKYPIPDNFPDILHAFAKEVVRERPEDIWDFAVEYFKSKEKSKLKFSYQQAVIDRNNPEIKEAEMKEQNNKNNPPRAVQQSTNSNDNSNQASNSNGQSMSDPIAAALAKDFVDDVVSKSVTIVAENKAAEEMIMKGSFNLVESKEINIPKTEAADEVQVRDFIDDVLKRSNEEITSLINNIQEKKGE